VVGLFWGCLLFVALLVAWGLHLPLVILLVLSVLETWYVLFQMPLWCGAQTRKNLWCRNNSRGLLLGCHLRQHRWQRLKMTFVPLAFRHATLGLWTDPRQILATAVGVGSILSTCTAVISLVFKK
jgi:hypothetical protein